MFPSCSPSPLIAFILFSLIGFLLLSHRHRHPALLQSVFTDRHGDDYLIPTETFISIALNWCIDKIPRFSKSFELIAPDFDLDNQEYVDSSVIYILLCGGIGLLFFVIILLFFLIRYACGCCGGKSLPRRGYSRSSVAGLRITIVIFSFGLEGVLLYSYFANSDFHRAWSKLLPIFVGLGETLEKDVREIQSHFPEIPSGQKVWDQFAAALKQDLNFSTRWVLGQTTWMENTLTGFEGWRMAAVLLNLILSTVGCSVGVAAGSVSRGLPVIIMIILNTIATIFIFFSAGTHFAGSKMLVEYCDEIDYFLEPSNSEIIPMRLQFFAPCVASPVFPLIQDYYIVNMVMKCDELNGLFNESEIWDEVGSPLKYSPATFWNVSSSFYKDKIGKMPETELRERAEIVVEEAVNWSQMFQVMDRNQQCRPSKETIDGEYFLFCIYLKSNLDMLTMTQLIGGILIIVITAVALPAIKKFEWAGNANLAGVFNGQRRANLNRARAKREG
jgi:hypothetical protein